MYTAKVEYLLNRQRIMASLILVALVAGVALVQAAGGIKGSQRVESYNAQRPLLPAQPLQQVLPQPVFRPAPQQPIKRPTQIAPTFAAKRPQPVQPLPLSLPLPLPLPQPLPQPILQQVQQVQQEQQQQQEGEIDPNADAQDSAAAIAAPAAIAAASEEEANPRPEPYNFNYSFEAGDSVTSGSSQREEQQDASGKVTGFYTLKGEDGRDRRVDYIADVDGFRATVTTNELGTAPKDSADVDWQAQGPTDGQLRAAETATQAARQRALSNPQSLTPTFTSSTSGLVALSKITSPRQNAVSALQSASSIGPLFSGPTSKASAPQPIQQLSQLQDSFEQIRRSEFSARARKSRNAPFYLFTI